MDNLPIKLGFQKDINRLWNPVNVQKAIKKIVIQFSLFFSQVSPSVLVWSSCQSPLYKYIPPPELLIPETLPKHYKAIVLKCDTNKKFLKSYWTDESIFFNEPVTWAHNIFLSFFLTALSN